jgi:hypothetical protein
MMDCDPRLKLEKYFNNDYEYVDTRTGRLYDQIGCKEASDNWMPNDWRATKKLTDAIDWYVYFKSNCTTVIDLTYFSPWQSAYIKNYISTFPIEKQTLIWIIE